MPWTVGGMLGGVKHVGLWVGDDVGGCRAELAREDHLLLPTARSPEL